MSEGKHQITIPNDLPLCQALAEELLERIHQQTNSIEQLLKQNQELKRQNDRLRGAIQKKRERFDADQLSLDFPSEEDVSLVEPLTEEVEEAEETIEDQKRRRRQKKQNRKRSKAKFPEGLPRYEVEVEVPAAISSCDEHGPRTIIGFDEVETLEVIPLQLQVRVTKFPRLVCAQHSECGVVSPPREPSLTTGNRYSPGMAAQIITSKYAYHLPTYRQQDMFAASGWTPSRSTLLNIMAAAARTLKPLAVYFMSLILESRIVGTDDTKVRLIVPRVIPEAGDDPQSKRSFEVFHEARERDQPSVLGRMWGYRSVTIPLTAFDFTVSRHRDGPDLVLAGYEGVLMGDCFSGYAGIDTRTASRVVHAACVTHARRKVFLASDEYPVESSYLLSLFRRIYALETRAINYSAEARQELRVRLAKPIWDRMKQWLESDQARNVTPKGDFGKSLAYLRNHWSAFQVYLTDGHIPIDNNDVEQLMKQIATGRKNWLFIGSVSAGVQAADLLTLVCSAVRNDLDVFSYINDVIIRMLAGETDYHQLRPDVWKESHPEAVRQYRQDERRDRVDRKLFRHAARIVEPTEETDDVDASLA